MAKETIDTGTNKVDVDLDRYTDLILKLDEAQDKIREMEKITKELKITTKAAQPSTKFSIGALFRDENDINDCLLYTSPSPRDISGSRMPSSA